MRKKGREVLFMSANKYNRRKGEGDFIRLKDGRIMYAFTEMLGENSFDDLTFLKFLQYTLLMRVRLGAIKRCCLKLIKTV